MDEYADPKPSVENYLPEVADCHYTTPCVKDMAICLVYFNPAKSKRILMNYFYTIEKIKLAKIPSYTLEMYYDQPEIKKAFHVKGDSFIFHKERLCRLLEKKIGWFYSKLMFMDSDIIFTNPEWYSQVSNLLNNNDVVQPFEKAIWSDITYKHCLQQRTSVVFASKGGRYDPTLHPGFAWAFKRKWFRKVGFFDYGITGSGDTLSAASWLDLKFPSGYLQKALKPAFEDFCKLPKPRISCSTGTIVHLWHGTKENRKYVERHTILQGIDDVRNIIRISNSGVFEITNGDVNHKMKLYFAKRNDDGF